MFPRSHTLRFEPDPPSGGGAAATLDDVATAVHQLHQSVEDLQAGRIDEENVRRIAEEVMQAQAAATAEQNRRRGFRPDDEEGSPGPALLGLAGRQLLQEIHSRTPEEVARLAGRPEENVREFHRRADELVLVSSIMGVDPRQTRYFQREYRPILQAMDSTTAAEGDEFVPTELSGSLIERVNLQLRVLAQFVLVDMPSQPFDIPGKSASRTRLGKASEQTADTGQTKFKTVTPATRKVTLDAKKFAGEGLVSKELEEDSIIAILPFVEEELVDWLAADLEDTSINGDTAATHQDADVTASDDPRKNWEGLRQLTPSGAKKDQSAAAALTVAMLRDNRKNMGVYGVNPADLFHLVSINGYIQLLADSNVLTVDKYGPAATIVTGELGRADGVPIVVSEYVRTDLDATGENSPTAANNTKQIALTVYRRGFARGIRRGVTVQILRELYAESDQDAVIVTTRQDFKSRFAAAEKVAAFSYNITS